MAGYRKKIMRKTAALIGSLLLASTALGTSTYAWFALNNTVRATGMSVTAKGNDHPFDIALYYYNGNFAGDAQYANPSNNPHGYLGYPTVSGTFAQNFTLVNGNNIHQTSSAGLYPGRKLTYAAVVSSTDGLHSATFAVDDFVSPVGNVYTIEDEVENPILLSYAIDVHCDYCPRSNVDAKLADYMAHDYFSTLSHTGQFDNNGAVDKFQVDSVDPGQQVLASSLPIDANEMVIFFTVIFSDAPSTYYSFVSKNGAKSYYEKDVDGDSNCYMSLNFQMTDLVVF